MKCCAIDVSGQELTLYFNDDMALCDVRANGSACAISQDATSGEISVHLNQHGVIKLVLQAVVDDETAVGYRAYLNDAFVGQGAASLQDVDASMLQAQVLAAPQSTGVAAPQSQGKWLAIAGIGFKLLKTVKVVKVALLAASVGVYSVIFTPQFAVALVAILMFHEYGHIRGMKKFGIPTKGIYLIPFFGGMAIGEKHKSQWQDVYISMMGPVYGLIMTVVFYLIYSFTGSHFAGLVASISALLNLFNLLPVHPLDGGRVIKALVFSYRNYWALLILLTLSAGCAVLSAMFGFYFLVFFIVLGVIDTLSGWRVGLEQDVTPLTPYGILFSLGWYFLVVGLFLAMIVLIALDGLPGAEIATKVLSS